MGKTLRTYLSVNFILDPICNVHLAFTPQPWFPGPFHPPVVIGQIVKTYVNQLVTAPFKPKIVYAKSEYKLYSSQNPSLKKNSSYKWS